MTFKSMTVGQRISRTERLHKAYARALDIPYPLSHDDVSYFMLSNTKRLEEEVDTAIAREAWAEHHGAPYTIDGDDTVIFDRPEDEDIFKVTRP